jgi:hypothetical protein
MSRRGGQKKYSLLDAALSMERAAVDGKEGPPPVTQALSFDETPFPSATALSFSNRPFLQQPPFPSATALSLQLPSPSCHPERTRISYFTDLNNATYVVLLKENHMQLTEAATLDRKSGEAEGSVVRHSCAPLLPVHNSRPTKRFIDRLQAKLGIFNQVIHPD